MMGAGKTATGKALAQLARMDFLDLDEAIESQSHLSINEIFQKKGEPYFRDQERKALSRAAAGSNTVVATGGGIVLDPGNVEKMKLSGRVIYLAAAFETLWERVRDKHDRPLLAVPDPKAVFTRLFQERRPLYESSSSGKIETEGLAADAVARKIIAEYLR
jgi:shikimate kinase